MKNCHIISAYGCQPSSDQERVIQYGRPEKPHTISCLFSIFRSSLINVANNEHGAKVKTDIALKVN